MHLIYYLFVNICDQKLSSYEAIGYFSIQMAFQDLHVNFPVDKSSSINRSVYYLCNMSSFK